MNIMAIEVFNRHEKEYIIDSGTYEKLKLRLSDYMEPDEYNRQQETYSVCNIYYDTDDSYLIRTSIKKPVYKEKLRLRSYGTPSAESQVYMEIKKKFRGLVNKRRSAMKPHEAYEFVRTAELPDMQPYMNRQVLGEVQYIIERYQLKPMSYVSYERRAYFEEGNSDLRISFDTAITTRRTDLRLESGVYGESQLKPGRWVMEIKTAQSIPVWLTRLLSEYSVYSSSYSKYGSEYKNSLTQNVPEESIIYVPVPNHSGINLPA